jgi:hypothetical protein
MLVYAFDLLHAIYEEQGYDPREIPTLIVEKNLYGIEIDERAGELAAFALIMKARARDPRFLNRDVFPRICVLENISFTEDELERYMNRVGRNLFTADLRETLEQFSEAKHFGSLIRPIVGDVSEILRVLNEKNVGWDIFLNETHQRALKVLRQAEVLSTKYHVVVANPPYLGKAMNPELKEFAKRKYSDTKSDLFAMFIDRGLEMVRGNGFGAMVTMQSWMFLSSYEKLRSRLMKSTALVCMSHMANMVMGIAFGTAATVWSNSSSQATRGAFCYVEYEDLGSQNAPVCFPPDNSRNVKAGNGGFFRASAAAFKKIPGSPVSYWIKNTRPFDGPRIRDAFESGGRTKTHGNETYLRYWWEVARQSSIWAPYANGGDYRKYAGNDLQVVNWSSAATSFYDSYGGLYPQKYWYKEGITWGLITSARTSFRLKSSDAHYSSGAPTIFESSFSCDQVVLGFLNSPIAYLYLKAMNPTLNTTVNDGLGLPLPARHECPDIDSNVGNGIALSRTDWDAYERSWDFQSLPILTASSEPSPTLESSYTAWIAQNRDTIAEMKRLEEENNRLFIDAYGLQDELTPEVPLEEITLTVNPAYRYGVKGIRDKGLGVSQATESSSDPYTLYPELEARFRQDTMEEFISYAVGCMLGRYSLDKPGLILANQGETINDYLKQVPEPTFMPDRDNVIPILDGDWFTDDIVDRFCQFLRVTFGDEHYHENLAFIEKAIGKSIRKYFLKGFYASHIKRYKKRPIYWLFSSPKGSFNALIYMHRYTPDTVSIVLNDYLREFRAKLTGRKEHLEQVSISGSASSRDKTAALKEIEKLKTTIAELETYETETLYPLATQRIEIDLDDGVKVNYNKFGKALKKIKGLSKE